MNKKIITLIIGGILVIGAIIGGLAACGKKDNDKGGNTPDTPSHTHTYGAWSVTTAPTCTTAGTETRTCTADDGAKETRSIPALGHDYGEWVVITPATTTSTGLRRRTCKHDSAHYEDEIIPKLPDPNAEKMEILNLLLTITPDIWSYIPQKMQPAKSTMCFHKATMRTFILRPNTPPPSGIRQTAI